MANREVILFVDEFTNYYESDIGKCTVELLQKLGYQVSLSPHEESGRAAISKGMLNRAARLANSNVRKLSRFVNDKRPLVGIEPSAILSFRDEYPKLVNKSLKKNAAELAKHCYTVEEFLYREFKSGPH